MPGGSGRNSFVGWALESAWGTVQAPTKYAELVGDALKGLREREPRQVYRDLDPREGQLYDKKFGAEGGFTIEGNYIGLTRLFEHLHGDGSDTIVQVDVAVRWSHTYAPQDTLMIGKGLSVHLNTDVDNGSTPQKRVTGFKINRCTMRFDPTKNAQFAFEGAGKEIDLIAASTPTFPAITEYIAGHQCSCEIDDVARAVDEVEIVWDNGMDLDKRILGSKNIAEPIRSDTRRSITGTIKLDAQQADFSKFLAGTLFKFEVLHTGNVLGTGNFRFDWTFAKCLVTEDPYVVTGPGVVKANIPFRVLKPTAGTMSSLVIHNNESAVA